MSSSTQQLKQAETEIAVLQVRFTNLDDKIDDLKVDVTSIRDEIKESSEKATILIKDFQADNITSHKEMSEKISDLEKWRWMIMGAGLVIGSLGSFVVGVIFN
jgi:predicted  nucleic acid-binding Zn-ribbon protein